MDELNSSNRLVEIRYSNKEGASIYRASIKNVQVIDEPTQTIHSNGKKIASKAQKSNQPNKFGSSHSRTNQQKSAAQIQRQKS